MKTLAEIEPKTGQFYLGREIESGKELFFESKNLTTHAICVGMTGSGKSGLGIVLLEEAALGNIPAIIIDPKGDMGNLLLTFPDLNVEDFEKWNGNADTQKIWSEGLKKWGESPERIKKLKASADFAIYTPGSRMGRPISALSSFDAPKAELNEEEFQELVNATTSGLLSLIGIEADPIKSREHILIAAILNDAWKKGQNLELSSLIGEIQKPPFTKIGVLDVDTFYPSKDRLELAMKLNNLLAAPSFQSWIEGEPLDIQSLLYTKEGKPRLSVFSIAHLSDNERMFFVTLLLTRFISWMRRQPGTNDLRALLYMDEIFGYFPPTREPPSKRPMLTLLKQARAYGVGILLATQNPVDLDYKGLSNCGTWFIGKLQTDRDRSRVLEGLNLNQTLGGNEVANLLNKCGKRIFLLYSVHISKPVLFETRFTLSYLMGPMTLTQIKSLGQKIGEVKSVRNEALPTTIGLKQYYLTNQLNRQEAYFKPKLLVKTRLHFVDSKAGVDTWIDRLIAFGLNADGSSADWETGEDLESVKDQLVQGSPVNAKYAPFNLPVKSLTDLTLSGIYQSQVYNVYKSSSLKLFSKPNESEEEFKKRVEDASKGKNQKAIDDLKAKYDSKIATLQDRIRRAEAKAADQRSQVGKRKMDAWLSAGATLLKVIMGGKANKTTINDAGTTFRRASKVGDEEAQAGRAEENVDSLRQQLESLKSSYNAEKQSLVSQNDIESFVIRPRKGDIQIGDTSILWVIT